MQQEQQKINLIYKKLRRQGKQDVRVLSLLLFLGLCLYTVLSILITFYFTQKPEHFLRNVLVIELTTLFLWGVSFYLLWKYIRLGIWLFWLIVLLNMFFDRHMLSLFVCELEPLLLKYVFILLLIGKCGMLFYGGRKLIRSKTIRSIWHIDYLSEPMVDQAALASDDAFQLQRTLQVEQLLRRTSIQLGVALYLSMLCIFLLLSFLSSNLSSFREALIFIQKPLLSSCLFSALVWSIPMIIMYMKKQWGANLLVASIIAETMRVVVSLPQYGAIITHKGLPEEIKVLYFILELLRFLLLYFSCHRVISFLMRQGNQTKEAP